jgi:integrase
MGIKKQSDGTFTVMYAKRHPISRVPQCLRRIKILSLAEAKRVERELIIKVEDKLREKTIPKWGEFIQEYYKRCQDECTQKTAQNYLQCINHHTMDAWGKRFIDSISTDEIRSLIKIKTGDKSKSHQRNVLHFIRGTFTLAVERGIINRNPTPDMKFRIGDKIKKVLTEDQIRLLLTRGKEYDWEWYPHVAIAVYTGMRNGELYALTWDKVNLEDRRMLVDSSWNKIDGFKSTKSGDDRMVEIAPPLITILKELKLKSTDKFVLPRLSRWEQGHQAHALRMFSMGLGLPLVRFHDLRASWATLMLSKGIEPAKVMVMGGWKELKTLMIYLRKSGISIRGITDGLNLHDPNRSDLGKVLNFERA